MNGSASAKFGDDKRDALDHQAGNEGNIARQAVKLRHNDWAFDLPGKGEGSGQLRTSIKCIRALSGFDLGELLEDDHSLGLGKAGDRGALGLDAQARASLPLCGDSIVGDRARHVAVSGVFKLQTTVCSVLAGPI